MGVFDQHFAFCKLSNESIVSIKFDDTVFPHYFLKKFEKTDCFLLLYNIADKKSFENLFPGCVFIRHRTFIRSV